ncbi:hypothetical protein ACEWY4_004472 [Coilia grayii]|uniref:SCP domain-containing protein n=1 Tax=Coilia grayii TaxID=363190 RepID=A0ABD1KLQ6_9TELE
MQHSQADYGENLFYAWSSGPKKLDGKEAVENWYSEIKDYSFRRPGFQSGTGHFTQVVWKGSEELGVGLATDGNTVIVVGQYLPAGNISNPGYFEKNVLPAGSAVKVQADAGAGSGGSGKKVSPSGEKPRGDQSSSSLDGSFEREFLEAHNSYRQLHGASSLTMSRDLCRSAQKWADHLLASKKMQHSQADHGENLFYAWSSAPKQLHGKTAVENWYSEIKDYNFRKPGFQSSTGHFTQVVWKGSKELGVGLATDGNTVIVVGQYLPAGNISNPGYFEKNVLPAGSPVETHADTGDGSGRNTDRRSPSKQTQGDKNSSPGKKVDSLTSKLNSLSATDSSFEREFLEAHNSYRQLHGASPLTMSRDLCRTAQKWADHLLASKKMQHSQADHGENLYYAWSSAPKQIHGKEAVDNWYSEIKDYNFRKPGFQSGTGHFTQVVWRGSEELGVGLATDGNTVIVVGQYLPAGNITNPGYFEKNVLPAGSSVKAHADAGAASGGSDRQKITSGKPQGGQNEFRESAVDAMNRYRRQHGAKPLSLCPSLSKEAQDWAASLAASRTLRNHGKGHGESLWYQSGSSAATPDGSDVVKSWYDESSKYNFSSPGFQKGAGNFTQMVWKSSQKVGIGLATDGSGMFIGVAFFEPAGNISNPGYFRDNVSTKK